MLNCIQILLSATILAHLCITPLALRLSVSTPLEDINEDQMIAFNCRVWNIQARQSVIITRHTEDILSETLSWDADILANVDDRFFLAVRSQNDGSVSYFLSVTEVTRRDSGKYTCQVLDQSEGRYIAEESEVIEVNYTPSYYNPSCSPVNDLIQGTTATFNCTSDVGRPPVQFQWSQVGDSKIIPATKLVTTRDVAFSELTLNITRADSGVVYLCTITSDAFPEFKKTCFVGPLVVKEAMKPEASFGGATVSFQTTRPTSSTITSVKTCRIPCPLTGNSQMLVVTFVTIVIITIALLIWISYMYRKLHQLRKTPPEFRRPTILHIRGEEDFYVPEMSSSNKSSNESDGRPYMTLERPRIDHGMANPIMRVINRIDEDTLSLEADASTSTSSDFAWQSDLKRNI